MSQRFFVEVPVASDRVCLRDDEAHHLARTMRAAVGDTVTLFDGSGAEFPARIVRIERGTVELAVLARCEANRELPCELVLGVALPKGDRQRWLIEKAVELGVTRVVPLVTARGVAQPADQTLKRLRRAVVEASKQCGRNRLLCIEEPRAVPDFLANAPNTAQRVLAHPMTTSTPLSQIAPRVSPAGSYGAIGPEGGFTDEELTAATGWQRISLGPRILRIETAAIALAAWLSLSWPSTDGHRRPSPGSDRSGE
jgi:16S rRNA (uracil1498-N3)-methyltransferase